MEKPQRLLMQPRFYHVKPVDAKLTFIL